MTEWTCRLTIIGPGKPVAAFGDDTAWQSAFGARHVEWMQLSRRRHVCEFETNKHPVEPLVKLSRRWPRLTLLIDYENERNRIKGLAKGKAARVEHCEIGY
jgi:hypothetical protein